MKTKVSPAIVGAFVIGAFALLTLGLLSFGGISFFNKPERFIIYFGESVHGLDLGSVVKLRGVRVGRVTSMSLRHRTDAEGANGQAADRFVVAVVCELTRDAVADAKGEIIDISRRDKLEELVKRGLRARLEVAGLATGLLFVQLDFPDKIEAEDKELKRTSGRSDTYVVVPSVESTMASFQTGLTRLLGKMNDMDLAGLSRNINGLVVTLRERAEGVDLKGLAEQWKKTGAQFEALARDPEIKKTFDNLNGAINDVRATIAKIDQQVDPTSKDFADTLAEARKTMQAFSATAEAAQKFIHTHGGLGEEFAGTLAHLNEAAEAIKRLADFLERNPKALLTGRKPPE